jgi:cell division protein FtsL
LEWWTILAVAVSVISLVAAIVVKPMLSLQQSITKLTTLLDTMAENFKDLTTDNSKSHDRIWKHNDEQDKMLNDHETRISVIEHGGKHENV